MCLDRPRSQRFRASLLGFIGYQFLPDIATRDRQLNIARMNSIFWVRRVLYCDFDRCCGCFVVWRRLELLWTVLPIFQILSEGWDFNLYRPAFRSCVIWTVAGDSLRGARRSELRNVTHDATWAVDVDKNKRLNPGIFDQARPQDEGRRSQASISALHTHRIDVAPLKVNVNFFHSESCKFRKTLPAYRDDLFSFYFAKRRVRGIRSICFRYKYRGCYSQETVSTSPINATCGNAFTSCSNVTAFRYRAY